MKFNRIEDGLPEVSGNYVVLMRYRKIETLPYSAIHKAFNTRDFYDEDTVISHSLTKDVMAWKPLSAFYEEIEFEERKEDEYDSEDQSISA